MILLIISFRLEGPLFTYIYLYLFAGYDTFALLRCIHFPLASYLFFIHLSTQPNRWYQEMYSSFT